MQFVNTIHDILETFPDNRFDLSAWRSYATAIHPELAGLCEQDANESGFWDRILSVVQDTLNNRDRLERLRDVFDQSVRAVQPRLPMLFDREPTLTIVLYLGLCSGAGWATTLGGEDAVLLGAEKIIELDWDGEREMKALIAHEIGHVWHKIYRGREDCLSTQSERSLFQLYQEGVAMVCEHLLCGEEYYHQDKDGWLSWCMENESAIKSEYLSRLREGKSTQDFFGDWMEFRGHSDVGYFLGCRFVRDLQEKYSLPEIANLSLASLEEEFSAQ